MGSITARGFNHVALYVRDVRRSAEWYKETLGMEEASAAEHRVFLRLADGPVLALFQDDSGDNVGPGLHHLALSLPDDEKEAALDVLREKGIELARRGPSLSFQDPDGYWIHF